MCAYDPAAMDETRRIYGECSDLLLADSPMDAVKDADALLIVTEWKVFRCPNFDALKTLLRNPVVLTGVTCMSRRLWVKWILNISRLGGRHEGTRDECGRIHRHACGPVTFATRL